jgi:hypothetical protein
LENFIEVHILKIYYFSFSTPGLAQQTQEKEEQEKLEREKKIDPRFCG